MDGNNKAIDRVSYKQHELIQTQVFVHNSRVSAEQEPRVVYRVTHEADRSKKSNKM